MLAPARLEPKVVRSREKSMQKLDALCREKSMQEDEDETACFALSLTTIAINSATFVSFVDRINGINGN